MVSELGQLWRGELPVARALISYALIYGLVINLLLSGIALIVYMMTSSGLWLSVLHFAALPYNAVACVGTLRSVDRFKPPPAAAALARVSAVGIFAVLLLI